jgi:hypothetical protein
MKKLTIFAVAGLVIVGLASMASAHKPEGEKYFAFQFEDGAVPTIDGVFNDWVFVPEFYRIRGDRIFSPNKGIRDVGRGDYDPSDVNIVHMYGFNPNDEFVYISTEMFDDYHDVDREDPGSLWRDDDYEVRFNATALPEAEHNLEGEPVNFVTYVHCVPPLEGVYERILPGEDKEWMVDGGGNLEFGWTFTGEMLSGEGTYFYEMKLRPIIALADTEGDTDWMDLEEGEELHVNITMADTDAPQPATYNGFWALSPGPSNNPEVDLVLDELDSSVEQIPGTAVEGSSWGMIKAGLSE